MQGLIGEFWMCLFLLISLAVVCAVRTISDNPKNRKKKK